MTWGKDFDLEEYLSDPENRARNADLMRGVFGHNKKTPEHSERNSANAKDGRAFEDHVAGFFTDEWIEGRAMVFKTDAKSRFVQTRKGPRLIYEKQEVGGPPLNPPDFMGFWDGRAVGIDAKRSTSSKTYYATRKKKRSQHAGILEMFKQSPEGLFGYVIEWGDFDISFVSVENCEDGKVRRDKSSFFAKTVEELFAQIKGG